MIVLNLQCEAGHRFEGWFASSDAFNDQRAAHLVVCPVCSSIDIERAPCAPAIGRSAKASPAEQGADQQKQREALQQLRTWVRGAENVGKAFPEEARRIHYGEATPRDIRGTASLADMRDLAEEGIAVMPVPASVAEEGH